MVHPVSASAAFARPVSRTGVPSGAADEAAQEAPESSTRVSFSERLLSAGKATRSLSNALREADNSKKEAARRRIEEIKQRIKMLRMLASGGLVSKGVLREIRQLAQALGQAAKVLAGSGGAAGHASSGENTASAVSASGETSGEAEVGQQETTAAPSGQNAASGEAGEQPPEEQRQNIDDDVMAQTAVTLGLYLENLEQTKQDERPTADDARQRRDDAELIEDVVRRLKALLALVKGVHATDDPDSRKRLAEIEALLDDSESIARNLGGDLSGDRPSLAGMGLSISV